MSKKSTKGQQYQGGKQVIVDLANLAAAKTVKVQLPSSLSLASLNQPLMHAYLRQKLSAKKIVPPQSFVALYLGKEQSFLITEVEAENIEQQIQKKGENVKKGVGFIVNKETAIVLVELQTVVPSHQERKENIFFGYEEELKDLTNTITQTLFNRAQLIVNGLGPLKGILISGFSGAGKSAILKEAQRKIVKEHSSIYWKSISSVELLSRLVGGSEQLMRGIFADLKEHQPSVLSIEDLHLLFGVKEAASHETLLATLLGELDRLQWEQIVVVATYHSDRQLNRSIRASGKFEKEVTLGLPNHATRLKILQGLFGGVSNSSQADLQNLKRVNLRLNGFSAGEIKQILRECYSQHGKQLTPLLFEEMLRRYRPSEIKELIVEVPQVYWGQIGGYESVKKEIKKVVELPLTHAHRFARFGIQPSKGILLYGPPGCSKTMMAKAIATESKLNFIGIKGPQLFSKYVGQSERAVRNIFKRARACSPCVIFFDEIDALASQRSGGTEVADRVLCQLLNEMDGIEGLKEVAIVAATNRPQILDKALMRPGRFDYLIYVGPPDEEARKDIFRIYLSKSVTKEDVDALSIKMAAKTQDYTGAQISLVCREAVMIALECNLQIDFIGQQHLQMALKKVKKRLTRDLILRYENYSSSARDVSFDK